METETKMICVCVYADSTDLFTEEEMWISNLAYLDFPENIVEAYANENQPEYSFEDWKNEYDADWTVGLFDYAKAHGFTAKR